MRLPDVAGTIARVRRMLHLSDAEEGKRTATGAAAARRNVVHDLLDAHDEDVALPELDMLVLHVRACDVAPRGAGDTSGTIYVCSIGLCSIIRIASALAVPVHQSPCIVLLTNREPGVFCLLHGSKEIHLIGRVMVRGWVQLQNALQLAPDVLLCDSMYPKSQRPLQCVEAKDKQILRTVEGPYPCDTATCSHDDSTPRPCHRNALLQECFDLQVPRQRQHPPCYSGALRCSGLMIFFRA